VWPTQGDGTIATVEHKPFAGDRILRLIQASLDDDKAIDPVTIELAGKSVLADQMVIATGSSQRHIAAMADKLIQRLKGAGIGEITAEGLGACDWVLIDAGDVIVHLFRAETRAFYDLEKLWGTAAEPRMAAGNG
jgi:ribosome-associated protein